MAALIACLILSILLIPVMIHIIGITKQLNKLDEDTKALLKRLEPRFIVENSHNVDNT